ncbi:MAG: hypothetical protein ACFB0B_06265 [Thermonemataceae bacterium]
MEKIIISKIEKDFEAQKQQEVMALLSSITLEHVMGGTYNLHNTRMAILTLAKGNLQEVITLTESAKTDFRDVIYCVRLDKKST